MQHTRIGEEPTNFVESTSVSEENRHLQCVLCVTDHGGFQGLCDADCVRLMIVGCGCRLREQGLKLCLACLSYDFIGTSSDESTEVPPLGPMLSSPPSNACEDVCGVNVQGYLAPKKQPPP